MLSSSSSSSLLLSTALPAINASGAVNEAAATTTTPDFAELLSNLSAQAGGKLQPDTMPGEAPAPAAGAPAQAASLAQAATATGKILPVALPEAAGADAAGADAEPDSLAKDEPRPAGEAQGEASVAALVDPLLALLGIAVAPAQAASKPGKPSSATSAMPSATLPNLRSGKRSSVEAPTTAEATPQTLDRQATGPRSATDVPISVAAKPEASPVAAVAAAAAPAATESTAATQHKLTRTVEPDAPALPQQPHSASFSAAQPDSTPTVPGAQAASAPMQAPSPADINAALDRLVAAREALMPAEAALAIDHSEFGEISIRFEQRPDGRLSAELRAADPELQRAVTAAVAADRGFSMTSEGDGGRSMNLANQRGAATGGDSAQGERGQPGNDRDPHQRRGTGRSPVPEGKNDPRSGVFA